jgi:hypothetical protein
MPAKQSGQQAESAVGVTLLLRKSRTLGPTARGAWRRAARPVAQVANTGSLARVGAQPCLRDFAVIASNGSVEPEQFGPIVIGGLLIDTAGVVALRMLGRQELTERRPAGSQPTFPR